MKKLLKSKKFIAVFVVVLVIALLMIVFFINRSPKASPNQIANKPIPKSTPKITPTPTATPVPTPTPTPIPITWPVLLTRGEASSITVVVNKKHKLPPDYVPNLIPVLGGYLRPEAATAITNLFNAAGGLGYSLKSVSDYRSYNEQTAVYNNYVARDGQAQADTYSARPGFSEHQTGLAVDVGTISGSCSLDICFGNTTEGKWLAANAPNYGFIIRYPAGKEAITGYQYEPWHLRYIGVDLAKTVTASGKTLDEYFGITAGDYQ